MGKSQVLRTRVDESIYYNYCYNYYFCYYVLFNQEEKIRWKIKKFLEKQNPIESENRYSNRSLIGGGVLLPLNSKQGNMAIDMDRILLCREVMCSFSIC